MAVTIRDNTLENNAGTGIVTYGAIGTLSPVSSSGDSSNNTLDARIEHNTVKNASLFGLWVFGGFGSLDGALTKVANHNAVTAVVKDNTVTDTLLGEGILLSAGGSGAANGNVVDVTARKNTVCGSAGAVSVPPAKRVACWVGPSQRRLVALKIFPSDLPPLVPGYTA